jgi:hypothetical protein
LWAWWWRVGGVVGGGLCLGVLGLGLERSGWAGKLNWGKDNDVINWGTRIVRDLKCRARIA